MNESQIVSVQYWKAPTKCANKTLHKKFEPSHSNFYHPPITTNNIPFANKFRESVFKTFVQYRMRLILHQTHVVCQKRDLETDNFNLRHFKSDRRRLMALLYYQQCRARCKKSRIIGDVDHNSSRQDPRASSLLDKIGPFFLFLISPGSDFGISTEVIVMNQSLVWNFTKQAFFVCNSFVPLLLNSREIAGRWTSTNALNRTKSQTNRKKWGHGTKRADSFKTLPKAKRTQGLSAFISST